MAEKIKGLIAPPFTAMKSDGSIDLDNIEKQARSLIASGVVGVFVCGTTGESMSLTVSERMAIAERWSEICGNDLRLIVHVGHTSLSVCRELTAHAAKIGADAVAAMAPFFFKPRVNDDLVWFCSEIAAAAPEMPFYYYNIPSMTGVSLPVYDFLMKAKDVIPALAGAKFTHEDLMDFQRCMDIDNGRFEMLIGRDQMLLPGLSLGAQGTVGTTYNFAAPLFLEIMKSYWRGDIKTARDAQARANEMMNIFIKYGGIPAAKAIMRLIGVDCGPTRPPLRYLTDDQIEQMRRELDAVGFFDYCSKPS